MAKVLIIEDEPDIRTMCGMVLDDAGHAVLAVATGSDGLQALRDEPGQLVVLLNHYLPDADSGMLLQTIEAEPTLQRHAYIIITAGPERYTTEERALQARLHVPIVSKPFDIDALLEAVAHAAHRLAHQAPAPANRYAPDH